MCGRIREALDNLANHANSECSNLVATFDIEGVQPTSEPVYGAFYPSEPEKIYLGTPAFEGGELGITIAHELAHRQGIGGENDYLAEYYGIMCGQTS